MGQRNIYGLIAVTRAWFERARLSALLSTAPGKAPVITFPVATYTLGDSAFADITMYPTSVAPHWLRLHIPKGEILAIVETQGPTDAEKLGFVGKVEPA